MIVAETPERLALTAASGPRADAREWGLDRVVLGLSVIIGVSIALRIALAAVVHGPFVFLDELGYHRLAHSLGESGQLALFGQEGLSYSPLYSVVLAPIYALGASAPTAYEWTKVVNAILLSLAVLPIYGIARFVVARRAALLVAALSAVAPLMYYSALAMSENLAYPLFLMAIWAMLVAVRTPSRRADAILLVAILAASAARVQLVVLYPIAVTAIVLAAAMARDEPVGTVRRVYRSLSQHVVLLSAALVGVVAVLAKGIAGGDVLSVAGRYAVVGAVDAPSPWRVLDSSLEHLAGLDLAVGVIPFVGTLIAAYVFVRRGARRDVVAFSSVAVSATAWLLLEVAYNAAAFAGGSDLPRIHERYLCYLVPLFLVAFVAAVRLRESRPPFLVYLGAAAVAALLPGLIPFESVINITIVADSFGLQPFGENARGTIVPMENATTSAIKVAGVLALLYALLRQRAGAVVIAVVVVSVFMSVLVGARMMSLGTSTAAFFSGHRDWVDRAKPTGEVVMIGDDRVTPAALPHTAFHNISIKRLYHVCEPLFVPGSDFGERKLSIDAAGRLRDGSELARAPYAVVPARLGLRGRVVARNPNGGLVLVATPGGRLTVRRGGGSCT